MDGGRGQGVLDVHDYLVLGGGGLEGWIVDGERGGVEWGLVRRGVWWGGNFWMRDWGGVEYSARRERRRCEI